MDKHFHFYNHHKLHLDPVLKIDRSEIQIVEQYTYLGVIFDRWLSFISLIKTWDLNIIIIIIIIIIMSCRKHRYPWPSLATFLYRSSPLAGLLDYIPYLHIVAECMFVLVVLLLLGHMWGSIRVHHLWVRSCFSSSVLHVWLITQNHSKHWLGRKQRNISGIVIIIIIIIIIMSCR